MTIKKALLATIAAGSSILAIAPASAQYGASPPPTIPQPAQPRPAPQPAGAAPAAPQRQYTLSSAERTALQPALTAVGASDWAAATTALVAAQAAARGHDAKYIVGQLRLRIGIATNNTQMQAQAVDELIDSGGAQPSEMRALLENQLQFATAAGDTAKAARANAALEALNPNDPARFTRQAQARIAANDYPGAVALYQQAIQAQRATGQPVPPEWQDQIVAIAYRGRMPQAVTYAREWLTAAPSPTRWHDTIAIYLDLAHADPSLKLDAFRLMRAAGAMNSEAEFVQMSEAANSARANGEVKAVLEEGLRRNLITTNAAYARERLAQVNGRIPADRASLGSERAGAMASRDAMLPMRLADAYFGYGDYAPAAELYRAALGKGGDAGTLNIRLGAALAMSGDRAGAETAFRAVTGPRAELAQLWLLWLSTHH
jgi:tetratricopeptide (TPR) repeat protein